MKRLIFLSAVFLGLTACKSENPPLTGPRPAPVKLIEYKSVEQTAKGLEIKFDPRVDILFVIDDSASMRAHQENLSENMHKFVDAIAKVSSIDFHIGFTTVHDSKRYGRVVPERCAGGLQPDGRINFYMPGTLNPLLGPKTKSGANYVTKDDDYRAILKETFDPRKNASLVKPLLPQFDSPKDTCPYGAEDEESFTPLLGAVDNPVVRDQLNKGFRREGALFVAIIVSDATDAAFQRGEITIEQVVNRLKTATGSGAGSKKQNFRVFAVAMKPGSVQKGDQVSWRDTSTGKTHTCKADPAFASSSYKDNNGMTHYRWPSQRTLTDEDNPLALLANKTRDRSSNTSSAGGNGASTSSIDPVLSICDDNYGDALARFGTQIQKDTLRDIEVPLNQRPEATDPSKKMKVFLGENKELVENVDYMYDVVQLRLVVYGQKIAWDKYPGASIRVLFVPVNDAAPTTKPL